MKEEIKVLMVDDHVVVREGIKALIEGEEGMAVVGEASDGKQALIKARSCDPDVILMDLVMPGKDGIEAIEEIKDEDPGAKILILTSFSEESKVIQAVKAGASGYLMKDATPKELIEAIRNVDKGESSLDPGVAKTVLSSIQTGEDRGEREDLTERETEVLKLIAEGLSNEDIADRLFISERTVRSHVSKILKKLELENRTQAALYAIKTGLAGIDDKI